MANQMKRTHLSPDPGPHGTNISPPPGFGFSEIKKPWVPAEEEECQFKCCHTCRPTSEQRSYLSINGILNDDIPPSAGVGFGFHLQGSRPVLNAEVLKTIGYRAVPLVRAHYLFVFAFMLVLINATAAGLCLQQRSRNCSSVTFLCMEHFGHDRRTNCGSEMHGRHPIRERHAGIAKYSRPATRRLRRRPERTAKKLHHSPPLDTAYHTQNCRSYFCHLLLYPACRRINSSSCWIVNQSLTLETYL